MEEKIDISCKWKKPCTAKDWPEHGYKCASCIWNMASQEKKRVDWPRRMFVAGLF